MSNTIDETRRLLQERLAELGPTVDEARRIEAALAALDAPPKRNGPAPPITTLDTLKPVEGD